ncbi:MAG: hypothetical protein EOO38_00025 [Cytophagaceae bacterium]|nr:MAG: hypothetical protein EOO38_00025 [Cytophagaceae bacterium]
MQYIARNMMQFKSPDGPLIHVYPGEVLKDFESWPYVSRQAHLRQGNVEAVGMQHTGNISIDQGYLSMGPKPVPVLDVPTDAAVVEDARDEMEIVEGLDEPVATASGVICTLCDRSFTRPARLKAHMEKHHP